MRKPARLLLLLLLLPTLVHAEAGPPMITDDPGTPEKGHWEINLAFTYEDRPHDRTIEAPLLDMNYGLFHHVQLKLEVPNEIESTDTHHPSGLGEALAGIKWRFLDEDTSGIAISMYPQLGFRWPGFDVSHDPADKRKQLILPFEFEKTVGPVTIGWEAGEVFERRARPQNFIGLVLGHTFYERFDLLGEVRQTSGPDFRRAEWIANGGFRLKLMPFMNLLGSTGTTFQSPDRNRARLFSYLALQFSF